jgi:hypothetical protein
MSIFVGRQGSIRLQREFPAPQILPATALGADYVVAQAQHLLNTDQAVLVYKSGANYTSLTGYVYRSELDRVYFHSTPEGALNNDNATRLSLSGASAGFTILAMAGTSGQTSTLVGFADGLTPGPTQETSLQAYPSTFNTYIAAGSSVTPSAVQGMVEKYRLNTNGSTVDTTALGDYFAENVKALISGEGTLDFYVSLYSQPNLADSDALLRTVLLMNQGSEARVQFDLRGPRPDLVSYGGRTPFRGRLYYEATIIFTDCVVDCSADDIVTGSTDFVTTGPIRLRATTS